MENSKTKDMWLDCNDFLKSQLPSNFKENLKEYAKNKEYSDDEFRLFEYYLKDSLGFLTLIVRMDISMGNERMKVDTVERWWNGLTFSQKRDFEKGTFGDDNDFEDNNLSYGDIEKMYNKYVCKQ